MRIMIFGRPGGGKSTFARELGKTHNIPVYHLDKYFYTNHWEEQPPQVFLQKQAALIAQESWILEGNAIHSLEMRYRKADCIIMLNAPRWLCLIRIFKRRFFKDKTLDDRADNCPEQITYKYIKYMWLFKDRITPLLQELSHKYPEKTCQCFHSLKKLKPFIQNLKH